MLSPMLVLFVSSLRSGGRQRGNSAVRRIDDERSTVGQRSALVPELVVGHDLSRAPRLVLVQPLLDLSSQCFALVFGQNGFFAGFGQTLERRGGRVRPQTLDVRITPGGSLARGG